MKKLILVLTVLLMGCSSVSLVENWKNPKNRTVSCEQSAIGRNDTNYGNQGTI